MEKEKITLRDCPFCGSDDIDPEGVLNHKGKTSPCCMNCGAIAGSVERWNTRITKDHIKMFDDNKMEEKFIVINRKHIDELCKYGEKEVVTEFMDTLKILNFFLDRYVICSKQNEYIVVNKDEPYAGESWQIRKMQCAFSVC